MASLRKLTLLGTLVSVIILGLGGAAFASTPVSARSDGGLQARRAARWVEITFTNSFPGPVTLDSYRLQHGKWNVVPPSIVNSGQTVVWGSESSGLFTGTEGDAYFTIYGYDPGSLAIHWDNPYVGSNSYTCWRPGQLDCYVSGGGGNGARVKIELV